MLFTGNHSRGRLLGTGSRDRLGARGYGGSLPLQRLWVGEEEAGRGSLKVKAVLERNEL